MGTVADLKPIVELAETAQWVFNDVLDYVWKAPKLIEALAKIEEEKLAIYGPDAREDRWREQLKLKNIFPPLVSQGNLFVVCSLFEYYVMQLAMEVEKIVQHPMDRTAGKGITRWLTYLRNVKVIDTYSFPLWPKVEAAFKIRNCLVHAQGALRFSKNAPEIHHIVKSGIFLKELKIVKSILGDRLEITNEYSYHIAVYLRDYFSNLCDQLQFELEPTTEEHES